MNSVQGASLNKSSWENQAYKAYLALSEYQEVLQKRSKYSLIATGLTTFTVVLVVMRKALCNHQSFKTAISLAFKALSTGPGSYLSMALGVSILCVFITTFAIPKSRARDWSDFQSTHQLLKNLKNEIAQYQSQKATLEGKIRDYAQTIQAYPSKNLENNNKITKFKEFIDATVRFKNTEDPDCWNRVTFPENSNLDRLLDDCKKASKEKKTNKYEEFKSSCTDYLQDKTLHESVGKIYINNHQLKTEKEEAEKCKKNDEVALKSLKSKIGKEDMQLLKIEGKLNSIEFWLKFKDERWRTLGMEMGCSDKDTNYSEFINKLKTT